LLKSNANILEIQPFLKKLGAAIYNEVPSGVGRGGMLKLNDYQLNQILANGAKAVVDMGYGKQEDLKNIESNGKIENANPDFVSPQARSRGRDQLGTMGAGNHFVEVEVVENIFDSDIAKKLSLFKGQIVILIHTGSRGLGHQVATDYIRLMMRAMPKYNISLPDRELACAPFQSNEGQNYFKAMAAAANFAFANRELITFEVRSAWKKIIGSSFGDLEIVYDVAHNIAKIENNLLIHRKGATRAFPDQVVLIPGSMGTSSYVLIGQEKSLSESFGSTCHGAGRMMSRSQAKREIHGGKLKTTLENQGVFVNAGSLSGLAEEAPNAYKNIDEVIEVVHQAGIAKKVARLKPVAVIKG
jgi:tRNA-splicing ligase RtcB